ncbi:carbohydrate-binding family 9-like protein [Prolixibacteraceae bacterium Z1-6]|uniref:Carbohydrate-binding family 9-like protein n=1 Tax=Draconibacterium aestuarii TaxID=2998507 RepID=A0A9X3FAG6_9BACT|nr:carbohydrate-binding family 9-like protein [Prolixibacteraceae bacterium Z1-6]
MKFWRILVVIVLPFMLTSVVGAQDLWRGFEHLFTPARNYVVYKAIDKIDIDGRNDEKSWKHAKWSEYFIDIEGDKQPVPTYRTRMKMLWDDTHLYILAELEEPHIWAYYDKNDMIVFHENDFEVFIDPTRDTHNYYEFEVNARNTLFDLFLNKPYRIGGSANIEWDAEGFVSAVHIDGTLNDPSDEDKKWTVEMAIPFSSLSFDGDFVQPTADDVWKINFSRVEWHTEIVDGKYVRKKDETTQKVLPENNWVWSEQGVVNMHFPERWGLLQFSGNPVNGKKQMFQLPTEEAWAKYLWLIYYKQQAYRGKHGSYAKKLTDLDISSSGNENGIGYKLSLSNETNSFAATLKTEDGLIISINGQGLFKVLDK